jgi:hypothetical protein
MSLAREPPPVNGETLAAERVDSVEHSIADHKSVRNSRVKVESGIW